MCGTHAVLDEVILLKGRVDNKERGMCSERVLVNDTGKVEILI
jgi:hypothetical protein